MDDRQTQIRSGAGLEDARLNQDFLDVLNKWSLPVLMTLAVAAIVWAGMQWFERKNNRRVDQAFSELEAATSGGNPSPASLTTLASEFDGVRSVPELALLTTCDLYLQAFVMGVEPGVQATGAPVNESDLLDGKQRDHYRDQAGQLAQRVLDMSQGKPGKALIAMQAMTRLAAVNEGQRDFEGARAMYEKLGSAAAENQYPLIAAFAQQRIDALDQLKNIAELPTADQLVPLPGEELPQFTQEQIEQLMNSMGKDEPETGEDGQPADQNSDLPAASEPGAGEPEGQEPKSDEPASESP